jgi:hypothetical protein
MSIGLNRTEFNSMEELINVLILNLPKFLGTTEIPIDIKALI